MQAIRAIKKVLFTEPAQKAFMERLKDNKAGSGRLRVTKVGLRPGDNAEKSLVEFVA